MPKYTPPARTARPPSRVVNRMNLTCFMIQNILRFSRRGGGRAQHAHVTVRPNPMHDIVGAHTQNSCSALLGLSAPEDSNHAYHAYCADTSVSSGIGNP